MKNWYLGKHYNNKTTFSNFVFLQCCSVLENFTLVDKHLLWSGVDIWTLSCFYAFLHISNLNIYKMDRISLCNRGKRERKHWNFFLQKWVNIRAWLLYRSLFIAKFNLFLNKKGCIECDCTQRGLQLGKKNKQKKAKLGRGSSNCCTSSFNPVCTLFFALNRRNGNHKDTKRKKKKKEYQRKNKHKKKQSREFSNSMDADSMDAGSFTIFIQCNSNSCLLPLGKLAWVIVA